MQDPSYRGWSRQVLDRPGAVPGMISCEERILSPCRIALVSRAGTWNAGMRESFRGDRILFFSHRIIEGMCPRIQEIWYSCEEAAEGCNARLLKLCLWLEL